MTRLEHIEWCKERAIKEMDFYNNPSAGIISMMSDLRKHDETNSQALQALCMMELMKNPRRQDVVKFLEGFR